MRRTIAVAALLAPALLLLVSCGLLLAPMEERVNPLDPKAQLTVLTLLPTADGTVSGYAGFDPSSLSVDSSTYALIRFDLSRLPTAVTLALLTLECNSGGATQEVSVYRILQPWDPGTISESVVNSGYFLDPYPAATAQVTGPGPLSWDLTPTVSTLQYGLAVRVSSGGSIVSFYSSQSGGTLGPRLGAEGYGD